MIAASLVVMQSAAAVRRVAMMVVIWQRFDGKTRVRWSDGPMCVMVFMRFRVNRVLSEFWSGAQQMKFGVYLKSGRSYRFLLDSVNGFAISPMKFVMPAE